MTCTQEVLLTLNTVSPKVHPGLPFGIGKPSSTMAHFSLTGHNVSYMLI